jgi:hypothetical protein
MKDSTAARAGSACPACELGESWVAETCKDVIR